MQPLAEAAGWLFGWLLRNSAHAAILAAAIWVLQRTVCRRLPPRWRYGLWLVVLVRLLLPIAPESRLSLFNLVDLAPAGVAGAALQVLGLPAPVGAAPEIPDPLADTPVWFVWALAFWFSGALTMTGLVWRDHRRLRRALATTSPVLDAAVLDLLRQGKAVMSVSSRVAVVETPGITSPAVTGWWRPRMLVPSGLLVRLTPDEIRFLFLHELAHVKRADLPFNWLIAILQILHWFNPIVWLALRRLLTVREEVCDDLVLRRCFPGAAREYGLTLLRILEECAPRRLVPSFACVLDDVRALRQRIRCIRNFGLRDPHPCAAASVTVAVAIVGLTERIGEPFLWKGNPPTSAEVAAQDYHPSRRARGRPGIQAAQGREPVTAHRRDAAARVVEALTTVLKQVAAEGPADSRAATTADGGSAVATPTFARSGPGSRGPSPVVALTRPVSMMPSGTRPFPLPPIGERGSILSPPPQSTDLDMMNPRKAVRSYESNSAGAFSGRPVLLRRPAIQRELD